MASVPRIVLAHGCFDVLHPGHVAFLQDAALYGDQLVVSVTADAYVRQQKGVKRPMFPMPERMAMLRELRCVHSVVGSNSDDAVAVIHHYKPWRYAKGADYAKGDPSGRLDLERAAVEMHGGQVVIIDSWPRYSSTAIMKALT